MLKVAEEQMLDDQLSGAVLLSFHQSLFFWVTLSVWCWDLL